MPGSGVLGLSTNGNERLRISSGGQVGIGTTVPVTTLDINGSARIVNGPSALTTLSADATASDTTLTVVSTGNYPASGILYIYRTTSPFTAEVVSYTGRSGTTFTGVTRGLYGTSAVALLTGYTVDTCVLCISTSPTVAPTMFVTQGNGIGLGVVPQSWMGPNSMKFAGNGAFAGLVLNSGSGIGWGTSSTQILASSNSTTSDNLRFNTNSTERVRIDGNGNVGIGTTNPGSLLDIVGSSTVNSKMAVQGGAAAAVSTEYSVASFKEVNGAGVQIGYHSNVAGNAVAEGRVRSTGSVPLALGTTSSPQSIYILNNGSVGIGTTNPGSVLHIKQPSTSSGIRLEDSGSTGYGAIYYTSSADLKLVRANSAIDINSASGLKFITGGTAERMRINDSGYVGIGTTNPTQPLMVAGNITPATSGSGNLGTSSLLFDTAYLVNGTTSTSDARKKTNVRDSDLGLEFINKLRPVSYYWREGDKNLHYGVIAQDTEQVLSSIKTKSGRSDEVDNVIVSHDKKTDSYGVRYTELIAPLIKGVQELYLEVFGVKKEVMALKVENAKQARSIASKNDEIDELKNRVDQAEKQNAAVLKYLCAKDPKAAICQ